MKGMELQGRTVNVRLNDDMSLTVLRRDGSLAWESSRAHLPVLTAVGGAGIPLSEAAAVNESGFDDGKHKGFTVRLSGFKACDVVIDLTLAIDAGSDELLLEVAQTGGQDKIRNIQHLYRFEKPTADGGYLVLPHGSGYLIHADCPDELPGQEKEPWFRNNLIGSRWSLPMFGMVKGRDSLCIIADTWWDCEVKEEHVPGARSALDFNWLDCLGKLDYPRRMLIRFAEDMDYVAMAKLYRVYAREQGLVRALEEKAEQTPVIRRYMDNILLRWPAWNAEDGPAVMENIRAVKGLGLGVNFFYPKWSSLGYSEETNRINSADAGWQAYLQQNPVPGGWPTLVQLATSSRELGCVLQAMITMRRHQKEAPGYDDSRWALDEDSAIVGSVAGELGNTSTERGIGLHDAIDRLKMVLDNIEANGLAFDVLYFDGFSAYAGEVVDYSPSHPMTRGQNYEMQNRCFAETRRRGMMPAAELARFWCMADCDYFFFTDWSSDRLCNTPFKGCPGPVGEPVPLFELVFHDCYMAGFSGGGYALYLPGCDWWADRTPRLYELMFASAPAYNWLQNGAVPIQDIDSDETRGLFDWLRRWHQYYTAIATSEMTSHRFLTDDRTRQRVEFANGVAAEFDIPTNKFRITGAPGLAGEWESPKA